VKVLYLSPTGALGGAERVLLSVLRGVRQARSDAQLRLLSFTNGPLLDEAGALGVESALLPLPASLQALGDSQLNAAESRASAALSLLAQALAAGTDAWQFVNSLRRAVHRFAPDLIHSNGIKTHCLVALADRANALVIWHVHDFLSARPMARRLLRMASRRMAAAIAISPAVSADLEALGIARRTRVIANAVDVEKFTDVPGDGALLDTLAGLPAAPAGCLRVGLVATYARWKGHDVFLEAAAKLHERLRASPVRFYVVGGPIYQTRGSQWTRSELRDLARALGIADCVGFIDFQANVAPLYQALDVVVHASTAPEPFGLTIIEAMACGRPVVASLAGGVTDIIRNGHDALGTSPGDVAALASVLQALLDDARLRERLGAAARQTACQRFAQDRIGPQVLGLYDEVLALGRVSSRRPQREFTRP
jgi:glycosyltransferase involved in cell wall biosynthesis